MLIRPYRPSDREGVRRVCFETGYMGDPVAWQWRDRESFADLFSGWYTDHAGADALVVVDEGRTGDDTSGTGRRTSEAGDDETGEGRDDGTGETDDGTGGETSETDDGTGRRTSEVDDDENNENYDGGTGGGEVLGYLLGCRDSRRVPGPGRLAARHLVGRGLLVRPGTAPVLWRTIGDLAATTVRTRRPPAGEVIDDRWPAHLHIDLLPAARGHGVGRRLMARWLETLRADGIPGCHLTTWAENDDAIAFFEATGFRREGPPRPMPGLRSPEGHRHHTQLMVQPL